MLTPEIVELARNNHALQRKGELGRLVDIVRLHEPKVVLEIGTFRGGTLAAWSRCADADGLLIGVDMPGGEFGGGWSPEDKHTISNFAQGRQGIVLIEGNSHEPATKQNVLDVLDGRLVDFLFIDGDHTFEGVQSDYIEYSPLVAPGGIIAFHDVVPYPEVERCEVDRFWRDEILPAHPDAIEIRTDGDYAGCGIGVIRA